MRRIIYLLFCKTLSLDLFTQFWANRKQRSFFSKHQLKCFSPFFSFSFVLRHFGFSTLILLNALSLQKWFQCAHFCHTDKACSSIFCNVLMCSCVGFLFSFVCFKPWHLWYPEQSHYRYGFQFSSRRLYQRGRSWGWGLFVQVWQRWLGSEEWQIQAYSFVFVLKQNV